MFTVYHGVVIAVLVIAISYVQSDILVVYVIISLGITWFSVATLIMLFVPRLMRQVMIGDLTSDEVFEKAKQHIVVANNHHGI